MCGYEIFNYKYLHGDIVLAYINTIDSQFILLSMGMLSHYLWWTVQKTITQITHLDVH